MFALALPFLLVGADSDDGLAKKMLPIYTREASDYSIAVETAPDKPLELRKEPIFEWSSPGSPKRYQGVIFLWLREGRPAAIGNIFSMDRDKPDGRMIMHELHALDSKKLVATRPAESLNEWKPQTGLERKGLPDAPVPAVAPETRLIQMKKLAAEFSGYEIDSGKKRWELRLLPTPLYRYPASKSGAIDGALFALVSETGTDPEVLLLIEAREFEGKVLWEFALGRMSDRSLYVQRKEKEIWTMIRNETNTFNNDAPHLYRNYADKVVSLEGKLLARMRVTEKYPYGQVVRVGEK
ncbi:MAG TPA: hypothetical protein VG097_11280 [Gemmata sp.]|jgi:hypothetical protein|nr:hypothetical protein [Gemmata sp.]